MVEKAARLLECIAGQEDPWNGASAFFTQIVDPEQSEGEVIKTARFHMFRVKRLHTELLHKQESLRENPERFWLEYTPVGPFPEGLSAEEARQWFQVDAVLTVFSTMAEGDTGRRDRCIWALDRAIKSMAKNPTRDSARDQALKRQGIAAFEVARPLLCGMPEVARAIREEAGQHERKRMLVGWGGLPLPLVAVTAILMEALETAAIRRSEHNRGLLTCGGTRSVTMVWAAVEVLRVAQAVGVGELSPGEGAQRLADVDLLMTMEPITRARVESAEVMRLLHRISLLEYIPLGVGLGMEALSWMAKAAERNGCPGTQPEWVNTEAAADGAEQIAQYAQRELLPEIAGKAGHHLDELMDYAVLLLNGETQ